MFLSRTDTTNDIIREVRTAHTSAISADKVSSTTKILRDTCPDILDSDLFNVLSQSVTKIIRERITLTDICAMIMVA
jgi:hypothetical protein